MKSFDSSTKIDKKMKKPIENPQVITSDALFQKLIELSRSAKLATKNRKNYTIILDIDGTLFDTVDRQIAVVEAHILPFFPSLRRPWKLIRQIARFSPSYSILLSIRQFVKNERIYQQIENQFFTFFLSNRFLHKDRPYNGIVLWLEKIRHLGITILFVSGRIKSKMKYGTLRNLLRRKIIHPSEINHVFLKKNPQQSDYLFKEEFFRQIAQNPAFEIVALIDNEALICQKAKEIFPHANIVRYFSPQSTDIEFNPVLLTWKKINSCHTGNLFNQ